MEQFFLFGLYHLVDGYAGPARHDISDVLRVDFLFDQSLFALHGAELILDGLVFLLLLTYA